MRLSRMPATTNPLVKATTPTSTVSNPLLAALGIKGGRTRKMRKGTRKMRARKGKSRRSRR